MKLLAVENGIWLDASDIGQEPGQFYWSDGTQVDNSTWKTGEPDAFGAGTEACAYLSANAAKLRDWSCSGKSYILCEVPSALAFCF